MYTLVRRMFGKTIRLLINGFKIKSANNNDDDDNMIFFFYDRWLSSLLLKIQLNAKLIDYSYISLNYF